MDENKKIYEKKEIARQQLRTATRFFLARQNYASVITLAGAAGNILHQLVINEGKEPFYEYSRRLMGKLTGKTPKRQSHTHTVNELFGINALKHLGKDRPDIVELDLEDCALRAMTKAMTDYSKLYGTQEDFVHAFYQWAWMTFDGKEMLKRFSEAPKNLKV